MRCTDAWAGSSLASCKVFRDAAVLTSSFFPVLSGGEVLANFFICNVHDAKDSSCVHTTDFYFILLFRFKLHLASLFRPGGDLLCASARKTPIAVKMHTATHN